MTAHEGTPAFDPDGFAFITCGCGWVGPKCSDDDVAWVTFDAHEKAVQRPSNLSTESEEER